MPSASREALIERLRGALPRGTLPALALVLLLDVCVANSTVSANWVPGSGVITPVAVLAGLLMAALALIRRIPWPVALLVGLLAAPLVAFQGARGPLLSGHPTDPVHPLALIGVWLGRIGSGAAFADEGFILALVVALFWVAGGWLAWSVLRWQQPLLGILPGAAVLATNILNFPDGQNGYVLAFLLLLCGLLLWTTYRRQLDWALKRTMRLSGEVRWDFWEAGVVVSVVVLVLGIFLPPLSTTDRTVDFQSGVFRSWADLQQRLNHSMPFGAGIGQGGSVGFALDVKLGASLNRTQTPVFVYQVNGDAPGPYYFRGIDLGRTVNGVWQGDSMSGLGLDHGQQAPLAEQYQALKQGTFQIQMLKPPNIAPSLIVYPGQLVRIDHDVMLDTARSARVRGQQFGVFTIDEVTGRQSATGSYTVTVQGPTATEDQLRQAGTAYPDWVQQYRNFIGSQTAPPGYWVASGSGLYRNAADMQRIHDLAVQVTAGATSPYDQAMAIESYLRGGDFKYTLKPPPPKPGEDPLMSFLFDTHAGYCEYFATAMGDMLRSLGLPVRLVNGFGPGTFDQQLGKTVVREADAHTWPEVYFPAYGWVPFEPTADGVYNSIPRGTGGANCRGGAENCGGPILPGGGGAGNSNPHHNPGEDPALNGGGGSVPRQGPINWTPIAGGVLAVLAILLLLLSRWLRPRSVSTAWRRTGLLARLAGLPARIGETPIEFGNRLAAALPQAAVPARELAAQFTISAYAPAEMAESAAPEAISAWRRLRPHLLRGVSRRLRRR